MRILGIDPGSRITGYGIVETDGKRHSYIAGGCVRISDSEWSNKLATIYAGIEQLIQQFRPDEVAIEKVFMHKNADSALKLGQARGAAICAVANHGLSVAEYSPNKIKQCVVGKGHANKQQIQHMVRVLLHLTATPSVDAADALAAAYCHANNLGIRDQITQMGARKPLISARKPLIEAI